MNQQLRTFLVKLKNRDDLTRAEASQLLEALLSDDATDAQIAATLVALSAKGETIDELAGLADALRSRAVRINCGQEIFIDTAGTGSSRAKTFNVSTAAAFVIAGAGLPVAKHGNRAASSNSGSADVLSELGVNIAALAEVTESCVNEIGICFMFAPLYHGATARVAAIRRELGIHTSFNLLGPLSNPAGAPRQLVGVWHGDLVEKIAQVLRALNTERAWVVHGHDGLDEVTLDGSTTVGEVRDGKVSTFRISPQDFGMSEAPLDHLRGGGPEVNAKIIRSVLSGELSDEARALIVVNAAAALFVGGKAETLSQAAQLAESSINSGAALGKLEALIKATNKAIPDSKFQIS